MKITKIILSILIAIILGLIGYVYYDISSVTYDWLGEGKIFFILCCTALSLILLRFSIQEKRIKNVVSGIFSTVSIVLSIFLALQITFAFNLWNILLFAFLIQSTWALWARVIDSKANRTEKMVFLIAPLFIGVTLFTGMFSSLASIIIGASLVIMTLLCLILLLRKESI